MREVDHRDLVETVHSQWDIPELRTALETIISGGKSIETFEVDRPRYHRAPDLAIA